jgi:hypothetical protein
MKALLMHRDRDFAVDREPPANAAAVIADLELDVVCATMAGDDPFLFEVARRALLASLRDPDEIVYRQQVLADCLEHPSVARDLYALAGEALAAERRVWGGFSAESRRYLLSSSVQKMVVLVDFLKRVRELTEISAGSFRSPGFNRFFATLAEELDDDYFKVIEENLQELKFKSGMLLSAQLGEGNRGVNYMLRRAREKSLLGRLFDRSGYSFAVPERDQGGMRALSEIEDKGVNLVANALAQSVDHVRSFFVMIRVELGFYVGCVNLHERLTAKGEPTAFPTATPPGEVKLSAEDLYDVALTLTVDPRVVGNHVSADGKPLIVITGANQGGKSTFLRSVGVAQLMMQCGMFVGASSFTANACEGIFTHYKREEDQTMQSGKLDEELARMSDIADQIAPNCLLLCNESFAATNEREGSQIAREVVEALLQERVKVIFVTHMFDLSDGLYRQAGDSALFLRAEPGVNGARPFKLTEGSPLPTSYGEDSFQKVFGRPVAARASV